MVSTVGRSADAEAEDGAGADDEGEDDEEEEDEEEDDEKEEDRGEDDEDDSEEGRDQKWEEGEDDSDETYEEADHQGADGADDACWLEIALGRESASDFHTYDVGEQTEAGRGDFLDEEGSSASTADQDSYESDLTPLSHTVGTVTSFRCFQCAELFATQSQFTYGLFQNL